MEQGSLTARLADALGSAVVDAKPLAVGFGLIGLEARLADSRHLAVKARAGGAGRRPDLTLEAYMLCELARRTELPVPHVHHAEPGLPAMDFIETDGRGIGPSAKRHAGELIARLHATPREAFGYEQDTLIGPLPQPNPISRRWVSFFRDQRLLFMAHAAHREGALPSAMLRRIERFAERIGDYLVGPAFLSLLPRRPMDRNVLVKGGRIAGFVDPDLLRTPRDRARLRDPLRHVRGAVLCRL
ncbi:MAG TPA: fructosamine kinase family protein [Methyloceanibacter sp.]|nr:fructosamine kinase family protein [Methyloceanibacter sp.]